MSLATRSLLVTRPETPPGLIAIPVRTPLVRPGDDLVAIVTRAIRGIARPGDVVAVSESAVAIAQGELVAAEYVRPSKLAFAISRRADPMATISQPESMQLVIDRVGRWKVIYATLLALVARPFGRRGAFYRGAWAKRSRLSTGTPARCLRTSARSFSRPATQTVLLDPYTTERALRARSSTPTILERQRFWGARAASAVKAWKRRCSTIRTAIATSRRRSSY